MHKGLYIIGLLLLVACTGDREVRAVLERAERYLPDMPDSADALLQSIDSPSLRGSGERVLSLYGLLRTMTDAMQGKGVTTDSLIRPAYEYYREQGESDENIRRLGRSAFYLAQFEASRDSTKRAEDLFREAIRCSEQVEDWRICYMAYDHFAKSITWSNTELAIQLRKQAIDIYNRCKDKPANYISLLNSLSNDYLSVGFTDSAFHCAEEAYQLSCDLQLEIPQYESLRRLSDCYYYTQDYLKALELAKQGLQGLTDQTRDASLFSLADCYLACDSLEQAKTTLLSIQSSNPKMQYAVYQNLSQIAMQLHDTPSAIAYSDSLETATVGMFTNIQQTKDEYYQETLKKELQNQELSYNKNQQFWIFIISVIIVVIVFSTILFLWNAKKTREKKEAIQEYHQLVQRLTSLQDDYELLQTDKDSLGKKQLSEIVKYRKQVVELRQRLNALKGFHDMGRLLQGDMVVKFHEFASHPSKLKQLKIIHWQLLDEWIKSQCPNFHQFLQTGRLSDKEYYTALLTLLEFKNDEMGNLLNVSPQRVNDLQKRANNKLFYEASVTTFMTNLQGYID